MIDSSQPCGSPNTSIIFNPVPWLSWILFAALCGYAVYRPDFPYDAWWYHLPFASFIWGIGGGEQNFYPDAMTLERFRGFPLLWSAVQGFAWYLTSALRAVVVPHLLLVLLLILGARTFLGIPAYWAALGLLACPQIVVHLQAAYTDLPVAIALALAFFAGVLVVHDGVRGSGTRRAAVLVITLLLGFLVAGNTKYQGVIGAVAVTVVVLALALWHRNRDPRRVATICVLLSVGVTLASLTMLKNLLVHGNPLYPLEVAFAGQVLFAGPESPHWHANYPSYLLGGWKEFASFGALNFWLSATELDWTLRGAPPWYTIHSAGGDQALIPPSARTGGWGSTFFLANLLLLAAHWPLRHRIDETQRLAGMGAVLLLLLAGLLPRAHELRYYMFIPVVLILLNLRFLAQVTGQARLAETVLLAFALYGVTLAVASPTGSFLRERAVSRAELAAKVPPEVRQAVAERGIFCDAEDARLFRFSTAATGLEMRLSRDPRHCDETSSSHASRMIGEAPHDRR